MCQCPECKVVDGWCRPEFLKDKSLCLGEKRVKKASKRDRLMEGRQRVSAFLFGESEQDFEFREKFQGQGKRELELGGKKEVRARFA